MNKLVSTQIEQRLNQHTKWEKESAEEVKDDSFDREKFTSEYLLKEKEFSENKRQALVKERQKDEEIQIKRKVANRLTSKSSKK